MITQSISLEKISVELDDTNARITAIETCLESLIGKKRQSLQEILKTGQSALINKYIRLYYDLKKPLLLEKERQLREEKLILLRTGEKQLTGNNILIMS
jgi:hypothetical protein